MQCIYQLNFTEGTYIGKTTNLTSRIAHHLRTNSGGHLLRNAWEKQGYLGHEVLEECDASNLSQKEVYWIALRKPNLNVLPGGETLSGTNHPRNKTSKENIEEIVRLLATNLSYADIAEVVQVPKSRVYDVGTGRSHTWATENISLENINTCRTNSTSIIIYDIDNNKHSIGYGERKSFCKANNLPEFSLNNLTNSFNIHGIALKQHRTFLVKTPLDTVKLTEPKLYKLLRLEKSPAYTVKQVMKGKECKGWKILEELPN